MLAQPATRFHFSVASVLMLTTAPAWPQQAPEAVPGLSSGHFVQGFLGLMAVIAVLLLATWLVKRFGGATPWGQGGALKVLGGLSVGPRERIVLVEVGETWLVIGVTASQVRTLHTMAKGSLPDGLSNAAPTPFSGWLKEMMEKRRDNL
jgi:flagellar protein FliO/FliZ